MNVRCKRIRERILSAAYAAGSNGAHLAPSLSVVEILCVIYEQIARVGGKCLLSKGHAGLALYATMTEYGLLSDLEFATFEHEGGDLPGQPSKCLSKGIDLSSGSLGMGLSYACGRALVSQSPFYVVVGDGETNEGSVWEAAQFAGHHKLSNVVVIVDCNHMQADGFVDEVLSYDMAGMWRACGWDVCECDGHDCDAIQIALVRKRERPLALLARTTKGKGVSFMENAKEWHHARLVKMKYDQAMAELGEVDYAD